MATPVSAGVDVVKIEESRTQPMNLYTIYEDSEDDESFVNVVGEENLIGYAALETGDQSDLIIKDDSSRLNNELLAIESEEWLGEGGGHVIDFQDEEAPVKLDVLKCPEVPSKEEVEEHEIFHWPFRAWCRACVLGRGRNQAFRKLEAERSHALPTISHDYGFLGKDDGKTMPMIVSKSSRTGKIRADIVPAKGDESQYSIDIMAEHIQSMGHAKFLHKSDQEGALKNVMQTALGQLGSRFESVPEESPIGAHQSNGPIENAVQQAAGIIRVQRSSLEQSQGIVVAHDSPLVPWLVGWSLLGYNVSAKDINGKTPI